MNRQLFLVEDKKHTDKVRALSSLEAIQTFVTHYYGNKLYIHDIKVTNLHEPEVKIIGDWSR